jgi:hypothetical protein
VTHRILIAGGPKVGKTTLSGELQTLMYSKHGAPTSVQHTDDLIDALDWSAASLEVASWMDMSGPWIIEGVAVPRALRKWLVRSSGKPADVVYWSIANKIPLTKGQLAMAKGCLSVWNEVREELMLREVEIRYF